MGSLLIAEGIHEGKSIELIDKQVSGELLKVFKPELVNRFDDVILFKPLSQTEYERCAKLLGSYLDSMGFLNFLPNLIRFD